MYRIKNSKIKMIRTTFQKKLIYDDMSSYATIFATWWIKVPICFQQQQEPSSNPLFCGVSSSSEMQNSVSTLKAASFLIYWVISISIQMRKCLHPLLSSSLNSRVMFKFQVCHSNSIPKTILSTKRDNELCPIRSQALRQTSTNQTCPFWTT